jgi:hypothetical protein
MSGRKAAVLLTANTDTNVYSPGTTVLGSYTVVACNSGDAPALFRFGVSASGTINWPTDVLQPDTTIQPGGVYERTGVLALGANAIHGRTTGANVNVVILGVE